MFGLFQFLYKLGFMINYDFYSFSDLFNCKFKTDGLLCCFISKIKINGLSTIKKKYH